MGRTLENLDRDAMSRVLYPVLLSGLDGMTEAEVDAAISACAEGYPFPTNLDTDPPIGGLAPESMAALFRRALAEGMEAEAFNVALDAMKLRQRA